MPAEDRKKSIMEHLARSTGNLNLQLKKSAQPQKPPKAEPTPPPVEVEQVKPETTKKRNIMAHLARSTGDSLNFGSDEQQRQQKIFNHVRKTRS